MAKFDVKLLLKQKLFLSVFVMCESVCVCVYI